MDELSEDISVSQLSVFDKIRTPRVWESVMTAMFVNRMNGIKSVFISTAKISKIGRILPLEKDNLMPQSKEVI